MEKIFTQEMAQKNPDGEVVRREDREASAEYFNTHKDFFETYARGAVKVEPAPAGLSTFAFNLKSNTIYVNDMFYREGRGFSDEKTAFAVCHEVEHFLEKKMMLAEKGGDGKFAKYLEKIGKSRAYALLDNCVADIRENRSVVEKTGEDFRNTEEKMYREDLFPSADFRDAPLHIQFAQAILRERRMPDEQCLVAEEVRAKLDELDGIVNKSKVKLLDAMTGTNVPMSLRLKLLDQYVVPMMEELKKKDLEKEKEKKKQEEKSDEGDKGEKKEGDEGQEGGGVPEDGEGELDPNEVFKEAYEHAEKGTLGSIPYEAEEEAFKEWQKGEKEREKENSVGARDKEYAESLGVSKKALDDYRAINKTLQSVINPETNQSVVEDLRELFKKIIARRKKKWIVPKYPL